MRRLHGDHAQSRIRMLAFDQLPRSIRDFMNESACDFPPVDVLNHLARNGEAATLKHLRASERAGLAEAKRRYQREVTFAEHWAVRELQGKGLDPSFVLDVLAGGGDLVRDG